MRFLKVAPGSVLYVGRLQCMFRLYIGAVYS